MFFWLENVENHETARPDFWPSRRKGKKKGNDFLRIERYFFKTMKRARDGEVASSSKKTGQIYE